MSAATLAPTDVNRELAEAGGQAPALLDVRSPAEFETVHIPGSHNVPLDDLDDAAERLTDTARDVVVVCQSGQRSQQAQRKLLAAGATNVHVLDGGLQAWEQADGDVVRGKEKWALERQVRLVAGSLVLLGVIGALVHPAAILLSAFVGAGLVFAALTNTCGMAHLLARLPYNRGPGADVDSAVRALGS
jgi:rhodanese-related sulfurtransferase